MNALTETKHTDYSIEKIDDQTWDVAQASQSIVAAGRRIAIEVERISSSTRWCLFWIMLAILTFVGETMIVFTALSGLEFQIFNQPITGTVFFSVVPLAFAGYHLQVHENYNAPIKKLFDRLGQLGILVMVFGVSALLGLSFVRGGIDSMLAGDSSQGWSGTGATGNGGASSDNAWEGFLLLLDGLPVLVFGIALCFSMMIAIYVASIAITKARSQYAYINQVHNRSDQLAELRETERVCQEFLNLRPEALKLAKRVPHDPVKAFSNDYFGYVAGELNAYHSIARVAHRASKPFSIEEGLTDDPMLRRMLQKFDSYEDAAAHFAQLEDEARPYNTQLTLDGNPGAPGAGVKR